MSDNHIRLLNKSDSAEGSSSIPEEEINTHAPSSSMNISDLSDMIKGKNPAAETGLVDIVDINAEGFDNGDSQDASRTRDETQQTSVTMKEAARYMNKSLTVLIVEDTLELAEVIQATLERMDLNVVHAAHGTKALEKFHELNPDVILLDISLPDMKGWQIMDEIKVQFEDNLSNMPIIIVITAYDDPANRLVGKLQGVDSYLIKPFTADEIESTVSQAISSRTR